MGNLDETQLSMLKHEMKEAASTLLAQEQVIHGANAMPNANPEKWMEAAMIFMAGGKPFDARKQLGMHSSTASRIYGLIMTSGEAERFRKERTMQIAAHSADLHEIGEQITANLLSDEGRARLKEMGPKELQQLAVAQKLSGEEFSRLTGNNVQRIEVRHITTPEEAMSLIDALPEADVIDVETREDAMV